VWNPRVTKGPRWSSPCLSRSSNRSSISPMKSKKILLIDGRDTSYWLGALDRAVSTLDRTLEVFNASSAQPISWRDYDLIILDAGVIQDLRSTISQIRLRDPEARVVVFSPAPTWKQAREVMLAGAADYAGKSLDKSYVLSTLQKNLTRRAPSWQRQG
jgi:DNA-binding NtrC family response regulator